MAIRDVIVKLQAHALAAGAKEAPADPTESNISWPFSVCLPGNSTITLGGGGAAKDLLNFELSLHVNRVSLPVDVKTVETFYDAFKARLVGDPTLGGTVNTVRFDDGVRMEFGAMRWAGIETVGMKFTIPVKIES